MNLAVRPITEKREWETFVLSLQPNSFLHSWNWKELNEALGDQTIPLGAYDGSALVGVALGVTVTARRGSFLFCPHGPLVRGPRPWGMGHGTTTQRLLEALRDEARRRHHRFLRVSPLCPATEEWRAFYDRLGFRPAPIHMHAETMWVLDIRPPETELLTNMRKTTRNLIHRGERESVTVRFSTDPKDLAAFQRLYAETAQRERFIPFSPAFLAAEFDAFRADDRALLVFAEQHAELLAAALIVMYGDTAFYHQGASSRSRPRVPAAYLLHWKIIQELKRRGLTTYNFWGIAPTWAMGHGERGVGNERPASARFHAPWPMPHTRRTHPWAGLTLFKQGFGGNNVDLLHAQDLPLRSAYWGTAFFESLRRLRRRL